ncbi:SCCPDH, partial [Symbiodinium microadriaticum]
YHEVAEKAHVLVIHACAFDSVPADLGVVFCMQKFNEKYGETHNLSSIESFLSLNAGPSGMAGHYTTYECAVHGLGDVQSLRRIRREATAKYDPPNLISPPGCPILEKHNGIVFDESRQSYIMPFMGADAAVVRSSFRGRAMLTGVTVCPQYAAYVVVGTWSNMLATSLCGGAVAALAPY